MHIAVIPAHILFIPHPTKPEMGKAGLVSEPVSWVGAML